MKSHIISSIKQNQKREILATVYETENADSVVIISPAMGVKQQFYRDMAQFLNRMKYHVVTFDYYAMLVSDGVKQVYNNSISDFGQYDLNAVIKFSEILFPECRLFLIGHSVAGQVFPLAPNANKITAACFVASQNVSKTYWEGIFKIRIYLFWYVIIPVMVRLYGFLPGFSYGGKYNLQKAIAFDWARMAKTDDGLYGKTESSKASYTSCNVPSLFISFDNDDLLAPQSSVKALMSQYGSQKKQHTHLSLSQFQDVNNPHFGYFRNQNSNLWSTIEKFFSETRNNIKKSTA